MEVNNVHTHTKHVNKAARLETSDETKPYLMGWFISIWCVCFHLRKCIEIDKMLLGNTSNVEISYATHLTAYWCNNVCWNKTVLCCDKSSSFRIWYHMTTLGNLSWYQQKVCEPLEFLRTLMVYCRTRFWCWPLRLCACWCNVNVSLVLIVSMYWFDHSN